MKTRGTSLSKGIGKLFLVTLALTLLLAPLPTVGTDHDGTVLFFSLEDLKRELSKPDLSHLYPAFSWRTRQEGDEQEGPIEHNYRWGNSLGVDEYTRPGTRPLWSYSVGCANLAATVTAKHRQEHALATATKRR